MVQITPAHKRLLELIAERRAKRAGQPPPPTKPKEFTINIRVSPAGAGSTQPPPSRLVVQEGSRVTVTATAAEGFTFAQFTGPRGVATTENPFSSPPVTESGFIQANFRRLKEGEPPVQPPPVQPPQPPPPKQPVTTRLAPVTTPDGDLFMIPGVVDQPTPGLSQLTQEIIALNQLKFIQPLTRILPAQVTENEQVKDTFSIDPASDSFIIFPNIPEKNIPSIKIINIRLVPNAPTPSGFRLLGWTPGQIVARTSTSLTATFIKQYGLLAFQDLAAVPDPPPGRWFNETGALSP